MIALKVCGKVFFSLVMEGGERESLTARRKANISSWPESSDIMPAGAPPEPTLPSAKTFRRSFPPSVSVSNWKLEKESPPAVNSGNWQTHSFLSDYHHDRADMIKIIFQFLQWRKKVIIQITKLFMGPFLR